MRPGSRAIASLAVFAITAGTLSACAPDVEQSPDGRNAVSVAEAFDRGGFSIIDDVRDAWADEALMASPASAVDVMQAEVDSGGGMPGADLDELILMPAGAPTFSYLIAAWLSDAATTRAQAARSWFPESIDWSLAPSVWFPRAALLLFVADAMEASIEDFATPVPGESPSAQGPTITTASVSRTFDAGVVEQSRLPAVALLPQQPCTAVSDFFAKTINAIFSAVQLPPDFLASGGVLGSISGFLAGLFNTAVQLAKQALVTVIESLTAPVIRAIGAGVAIVGVVSHLSSYVLGVSMSIVSSERPVILDGRDGSWFGIINSNRPLEAQLNDCLAALGQKPLPDIIAAGAPVTWREYLPTKANGYTFERVVLTYPTLVSTVDDAKRIVLPWVAGTDPASSKPEQVGSVRIRAELPKGDVTELLGFARKLVDQAVQTVASYGGPLSPQIQSAINGILLPAMARLEQEIFGVGRSLLLIVGSGITPFIYREPDDPASPAGEAVRNCYVGSWRFERVVASNWLDLSRSQWQRFALDIGPDGSYQLRVSGWAVYEPDRGGLRSVFDGSTRFTVAPGAEGTWSVSAPPLVATESEASFYFPLGNGYALEGDDGSVRTGQIVGFDENGEYVAFPRTPGGEFGAAVFSRGLRPMTFACAADGETLVITGEADSRRGATVWEFRRS